VISAITIPIMSVRRVINERAIALGL